MEDYNKIFIFIMGILVCLIGSMTYGMFFYPRDEIQQDYYVIIEDKIVDVKIGSLFKPDYIVLENGTLIEIDGGIEKVTIGRMSRITLKNEWYCVFFSWHLSTYIEKVEVLEKVE